MDTNKRTIIKTITWRIIATVTTVVVIWIWTGSWYVGLGAGLVANAFKTLFYYIHERAWNLTDFGRKAISVETYYKKKK